MAISPKRSGRSGQIAAPLNPPLPAQVQPAASSELAEISDLFLRIRRKRAKLIGPDGETRDLPGSLRSLLVDLLDSLSQGKMIALIPEHAALTTIQASEQLGVSRKFLVGLLEKGDIPFHYVGTHRRVYARDLFRYKALRDGRRRDAIRDLARAEADEGIYDEIPPLTNEAG